MNRYVIINNDNPNQYLTNNCQWTTNIYMAYVYETKEEITAKQVNGSIKEITKDMLPEVKHNPWRR